MVKRIIVEHAIRTDGRHCGSHHIACPQCDAHVCRLFRTYLRLDAEQSQFIRCQECLDAEAFTKRAAVVPRKGEGE